MERLESSLKYTKQDLISSEEERKRLHSNLHGMQSEISSLKAQRHMPPPMTALASASAPAALAPGINGSASPRNELVSSCAGANASSPCSSGSFLASMTPVPTAVTRPPDATTSRRVEADQWRREALLREVARWEAAVSMMPLNSASGSNSSELPSSWFAVREVVGQLTSIQLTHNKMHKVVSAPSSMDKRPVVALAAAVSKKLHGMTKCHYWSAVQGGARFLQLWAGLFPIQITELVERCTGSENIPHSDAASASDGHRRSGQAVFNALAEALHAAVLDGNKDGANKDAEQRHQCIVQLLQTLTEIASKLPPLEVEVLADVLRRPSLCAILGMAPRPGSLHMDCLRLLLALLVSPSLFAQAHQAHSDKNPLLAASNLLIVPSVKSKTGSKSQGTLPGGSEQQTTAHWTTEEDSPEWQELRVAALELFCRCLASAPRPDIVLQLRGAPAVDGESVDTVLQRVTLLCHHELLCLGLHGHDGGPWRNAELRACAARRMRVVELALTLLSTFVWHAAPWTPDACEEHRSNCGEACALLGRARPLLASIVDMVSHRAKSSEYTRLLGSASALRVLLAHADGEDVDPKGGEAASDSISVFAPVVID